MDAAVNHVSLDSLSTKKERQQARLPAEAEETERVVAVGVAERLYGEIVTDGDDVASDAAGIGEATQHQKASVSSSPVRGCCSTAQDYASPRHCR